MATHRLQSADPTRRPPPRRAGITLIEIATVMAASAILLGMSAMALIAVQQGDRRWSREVDQRLASERLGVQLRRDLHAAASYGWDPEQAVLRLDLTDGEVLSYQRRRGRWERRWKAGAVDSTPAAAAVDEAGELRSAFPVPAGSTWQVHPATGKRGDVVRIQCIPSTDQQDLRGAGPSSSELVVVVGRDGRLLNP